MSDSKRPFIHLFRDPDKFKTMSESPEWQKFQEKCHQRRRLFAEIGMKPGGNLANFDGEFEKLFGVNTLYQSVHRDSQEFAILKLSSNGGYERWPLQECKHLNIPMEVLEEAKLVQQCGMFEELWIYCNNWSTAPALLVGRNGVDCYPIVYWGPEEVFNDIKAKLLALAETKNNPQPEVPAVEQPKTSKWSYADWVARGVVVTIVAFLIGACWHAYSTEDTEAKARQQISEEISGPVRPRSHCLDHLNVQPVGAVSDLPAGHIRMREMLNCSSCDSGGTLYAVCIGEKSVEADPTGWSSRPSQWKVITKEIYDQLKAGDVLPLKPLTKFDLDATYERQRHETYHRDIRKAVSELDAGRVAKGYKIEKHCAICGVEADYILQIEVDDLNYSTGEPCKTWLRQVVTKEVFDKVKIDDIIPPKPKPKSEDF